MANRELLCFTRAIALKGSGRICQLHVILNNNLSTLVTMNLQLADCLSEFQK